MKASSLITLAVILLTAFTAQARRHKKAKVHPADVWPEEVPDYERHADSAVSKPPVMVCDLTDEQLVEYLMSQPIMGNAEIEAEAMQCFVARHNPDFDLEIAKAYIAVGQRYGIRGDIALCQSILETGWFKFADGTSVTPDQHNYCGLGVLRRGQKGHSFSTIEDGVTAQIQHLYAYACSSPIPNGEKLLDPRFKLVERGVAPTWAELSGRWAANDRYARSILKLFVELRRFSYPQP